MFCGVGSALESASREYRTGKTLGGLQSHFGHDERLDSEMKRIGILTYHRFSNEGSMLQAIAVYRAMKRAFPNDHVEIIDYRSRAIESYERKPLRSDEAAFYSLG